MPRFDAFTGPWNQAFSPNIQSELTINWIPEKNSVSVEGQGTEVHDKNVRCSLIPTPGLSLFVTLPLSPCRGVFPGEFRLFAVGADHFYEIKSGGTIIDRSVPGFAGASGIGPAGGTIGNNPQVPVQCFSNGNQLLIISAGHAYVDNGNGPVPAQFSDPLTDLLIDPSNANKLTTATGGFFDQTDVGRTVQITGGAGFNVGLTQVITAVDSNGEASGASAWGVAGSGLGTGIEWMGYRTWTDLTLITPFLVSSGSRPFGPGDVGTTLTVTSGTGWTAGTYTITGLEIGFSGAPTGNAILDRAAGTTGASAGVGSTPSELVTAFQGSYIDGYGFVCPYPLTKSIFYSGAPDGTPDFTMWDPLNFFTKARYPDNVSALFADHEELYTAGDLECTEVWRDVGDANNPFMPDPGAIMHLGVQAPFSFVRLGQGVAWIAQDTRRGTRRAVYAAGYQPVPVSTPAVEAFWALYSTISDAVAYSMSYPGHDLWVISFPTANDTWVYDFSTGWWFKWLFTSAVTPGGGFARHLVWVHCVAALDGTTDVHYGGDWESGNIYVISRAYWTDNHAPTIRRRRTPHSTNENKRRFYSRFEIDCDVHSTERMFWNRLGNGRDRIWQLDVSYTDEGANPTFTLYFSDDRCKTWQQMTQQQLAAAQLVTLSNAYLDWTDASWH
jgi:hypothetical protein